VDARGDGDVGGRSQLLDDACDLGRRVGKIGVEKDPEAALAACMPVRTAAPLPRLRWWRRTTTGTGQLAAAASIRPAVSSALPSTTTTISAVGWQRHR
jgi:hypothetical protein